MPTLKLPDVELYYERFGADGPPLLFFNGTGSTVDGIRPLVEALGARFEVAVHDQRGLGRTSVPEPPYTMAQYAADGAALLDHLGWDRCRVIGISFGGMVAQELAVTWPDRIERLALLCTSAGGDGGSSFPLHDLADLPLDERIAATLAVVDTRWVGDWLETHAADQAILTGWMERQAAEVDEDHRAGAEYQLAARAGHDVWDRLPDVTAATLVAAGRYDGIAPLPNSQAIASRIPDSELRTYEGGHLFVLQDRQALPDVQDFLAG